MAFLHRTHLFVNRLLSPFGFAINRVEKHPSKPPPTGLTIQVGLYSIQTPSESQLPARYSYDRPQQPLELARLTSVVKKKFPSLAVIDVGANVGDSACIVKSAEEVPILCIEGDEYIFGFLKRNIAQFQNVTARKLFLGETTKEIRASFEKSGWNPTLKPDESSSRVVNLTSVDDFIFREPEWQTFRLVKIDTEGFDCSIIRGATNFLRKVHPVIHFEYNRENMDPIGEPGIPTLMLLSDLGYSQLAVHDHYGRFFCSTRLSEENFIKELHDYVGPDSVVHHCDITAFHASDSDLAAEFCEIERRLRRKKEM